MSYTLDPELLQKTVITVLIGALIGVQREFRQKEKGYLEFAGVRTFTLIALFGGVAAYLSGQFAPGLVHVALALLGSLVACAYVVTLMRREESAGLTTEIAALLTFLLGAAVWYHQPAEPPREPAGDSTALAIMLAVVVTGILSLKPFTLTFVKRIEQEEILSTLKFAIVAFVVLPVLPDRPLTRLEINPHEVWFFVVLVSAMSFASYLLIRIIGERRGLGLSGLLGGFVSSTAVTGSLAPKVKEAPPLGGVIAGAILLAWATMFLRILVVLASVNQTLAWRLAAVNASMGVVGYLAAGFFLWRSQRGDDQQSVPKVSNPFRLGPAVKFGILYLVVQLVARFARTTFGDAGVYIASVLAGITDVDAITLSLSQMSSSGSLELRSAAIGITLAATTNTISKLCLAAVVGERRLTLRLLAAAGLILAAGAAALALS
jgi:uncharacterized membrane protein (DUF4010 family)